MVIAGILTGVAAALLVTGAGARIALAVAGAALVGLTAAGIVQGWLDVVEGEYLVNGNLLRSTGYFAGRADPAV
jgi:hypothetical protein